MVVWDKLHTATVVQGRAHDILAHQQAATPERLLATPAADPSTMTKTRRPVAGWRST
ncbi:hypothetical protein [Streptomyces flaveolus]|uniref:hypothetical protein n=1 Tax=Streptomyces flaveolus TaxID=67297 RepID=UPI0033EE0E7C